MEEKKKKWMKLWKPSRKTGSMAWRKSFCWCITFREMIKKRTSAAHGFCCVIAFTLTRIRCAASSAHFYNHLKKEIETRWVDWSLNFCANPTNFTWMGRLFGRQHLQRRKWKFYSDFGCIGYDIGFNLPLMRFHLFFIFFLLFYLRLKNKTMRHTKWLRVYLFVYEICLILNFILILFVFFFFSRHFLFFFFFFFLK